MQAQLEQLEHVLFGGVSHPGAITLGEKLLACLPENQARLFFSDNGSTAIEVALKMSVQYHLNKGQKRSGVIAFEQAYHGDTFGAMAASGIGLYNEVFANHLLPVNRIPIPSNTNIDALCEELTQLIEKQQPAAFIFEPLVQGAA
ncbi:unnamed protein product, partial [Cyprideis torosa]